MAPNDKFTALAQADTDTTAAVHLPSAEVLDRVKTTAGMVWAVLAFVVLSTAFVLWRYWSLSQAIADNRTAITTEASDREKALKQAGGDGHTELDRFIKEKFEPLAKEKLENEGKIKANTVATETQKTTIDVMGVQIAAILKQIEDWKPRMEEERQMWFMEQNGISNQDAFYRDKGYYAPNDPRSMGHQQPQERLKRPSG